MTVPRATWLFALLVACAATEPPVLPPPVPPHTAPVSSPPATPLPRQATSAAPVSKPPALVPIPLDGFEDSARHYRNANGLTDYPRYLPEQYVAIAENILLHQRDNGGWRENWDPARILGEDEKCAVLADKSKTDTSLDNRTTYTHIEYLAEVFRRTSDERFRTACLRGMEFLLATQHPAGGFPHSYPDTSGHRGQITFMDDVTTGALTTLRKAADGRGPFEFLDASLRERCRRAVELGDACLLKLQVRVKGQLTVWAGQYDPTTLEPATARTFELPSLVSDESASVVRYLMSIERPSPEVVSAVEAAAAWFERAKIKGMRVETVPAEPIRYKYHTSKDDRRVVLDPSAPPMWARFYEISTNRPFMANRDGRKVYKLSEVDRERRTGYRWYGYFGQKLLESEYPAWREKNGLAQNAR
ncbi:MAG TPA: pectate lyase [Polyangiaceae bacterium]